MKRLEKSQIVVIAAMLFMVIFLMFAVLVDGYLIMIKRQELLQLASSAGKAGLIEVGNQIMTQNSIDLLLKREIELTIQATRNSKLPETTFGEGKLPYVMSTQDYQATLISPPIQTQVTSRAQRYIDNANLFKPQADDVEVMIIYPYQYSDAKSNLIIWIRLKQKIRLFFGALFTLSDGEIIRESKQSIPVK